MGRFLSPHDRVLPPFIPRVIVETALHKGASREALFAGTGLATDALDYPEARISYEHLCQLVDNAERIDGGTLAFDAGSRARLRSLGLLGAAVMTSETAGSALATLLRHWPGISPGVQLLTHEEDDQVRLEVKPLLELPKEHFLYDMILVSLAHQAAFILGKPAPMVEIRTRSPRTPERTHRLVQQFGVRCIFDAPQTEVVFPREVLDWPCVHAEPNTQALAERMHAHALGPIGPNEGSVAEQVERVLDGSEEHTPSVGEVAKRLGTSARTLRRMLAASGTSFRALREASLHRRSLVLLQVGGVTQARIAELLGYGDVRAFRRAFKRWTGRTPSEHPRVPTPANTRVTRPSPGRRRVQFDEPLGDQQRP